MATIIENGRDLITVRGVRSDGERVRQNFSRKRYGPDFRRMAQELYKELIFETSGLTNADATVKARHMRDMTVKELADRYDTEHLQTTMAKGNRSYLTRICAKWGDHRLSTISIAVVRPWIHSLLSAGGNGYTVKKIARYFYRLFAWGIDIGILSTNPLYGLIDDNLKKTFKRKCPPRRRFITQDQFDAFIGFKWQGRSGEQELPAWFKRSVLIAWLTGMRESEVCSAQWKKMTDGSILLEAADDKEADPKNVSLGEKSMAVLREIEAENAINGIEPQYIFLGESGLPQNGLGLSKSFGYYRDIAAEKGLPYMAGFRFHDLRHSYRRRKRQAGVPVELVRAQMGHHGPAMDEVYDQVTPDELRIVGD